MSSWTNKPCFDCGKKKGPKQRHDKRCYTCARLVRKQQQKIVHGRRIENTYGITEAEYWELYEFQGGRCYLCRIATGRTRRLSVDHDHGCTRGHRPELGCRECVRGLLCRPCNRILGIARDSVEYFKRAVEYLTDPPWRQLQRERSRK